DGVVRGRLRDGGLLGELGDGDDVRVGDAGEGDGLDGGGAVEVDLRGLDLEQRDDGTAQALLDVDHRRQDRVAGVDEVVTEEHREGLVAHVLAAAQHGVAQALGRALADGVDVRERRGPADLGEPDRKSTRLNSSHVKSSYA